MRLTLKVRSYSNAPPQDARARSFDTFPIIIGRSTACDYNLIDPSRYISSNHAMVIEESNQLVIQDTSANGVYLNGLSEPIGRGRSAVLNDGDTLTIGDYTLSVSLEQTKASPHAVSGDDPFADFGASGSAASAAPDPYDPFRGDEPDWTPPSVGSDDPFGDEWDIGESTPSAAEPPEQAISDWPDWDAEQPPTQATIQQSVPSAPAPSRPARESFGKPEDDFDWLPGNDSETVSIAPSLPGNPDDFRAAPRAPRPPGRPQPAPPPARSAGNNREQSAGRSSQYSNPSHGSSIDIMLRAASLRESDFAHYSEAELLEQTGHLLAQMVDAMMVLLQSRAEIKNAMKSDVTTLSRSGNNPLKFSFSAADALTKLLSNDAHGYMPADTAVKEAVDDLKLHQLAMLDGMKAAVRSMLLEFNPDKLAKSLEKKGGISANIPLTRDAKLWEIFCEQYDAIKEEAVNDFGELFGKEFRKAYEKRIRQLGRNPDF